ncbi:DUF1295 domain-containing protein [Candidatus Poriferisodalis sp.]|uniref:DUF1295 domain-containing protein n=1 Tax=Candidatus Poriferisodalis sp. TaxID=3101277 RepID=UPI003B014BDC
MSALGLAAAVVAVLMLGCWLLSLRWGDASIVDPLWPLLFVAIGWANWIASGSGSGRKLLLIGMVTAWGLRLGVYLAIRKRGEPEDHRYVAMRRKWRPFAWWSLVIVFGLQGLLATVVSLPLQAVLGADGTAALGWLDWVGATVWAVGLTFEAVADRQLRRFRADPANRGKVLDSGLWRYSRHPNYFGDSLVWWGIYLVAASAGAYWTAVGPILMAVLLLRVSGVALLERSIGTRRPAYAAYVAHTSAFVPLPPRRNPPRTR